MNDNKKDFLKQIIENVDICLDDLDNWLRCMKKDPYFAPPFAFMDKTYETLAITLTLIYSLSPDEDPEFPSESSQGE